MEQERRRSPRYSFIAHAEMHEDSSQVRVASRVSELSLYGCYLDMMNPFPAGTLVSLRITADQETFETHARVIYSTPNMGAGVVFLDVAPKYQALLERWLDSAGAH